MNQLDEGFNSHYRKNFDAYFQEIVDKEEAELKNVAQAYMDTYNIYITDNEEDEDYIEKTKKNIKK